MKKKINKVKKLAPNGTELFPASTLCDEMNKCHETGKHRRAAIIFKQNNFAQPFSEESRTYISHSDQWGWDYSKMGRCRIGSCLDGTETIRLDYHEWRVEAWYWYD